MSRAAERCNSSCAVPPPETAAYAVQSGPPCTSRRFVSVHFSWALTSWSGPAAPRAASRGCCGTPSAAFGGLGGIREGAT